MNSFKFLQLVPGAEFKFEESGEVYKREIGYRYKTPIGSFAIEYGTNPTVIPVYNEVKGVIAQRQKTVRGLSID